MKNTRSFVFASILAIILVPTAFSATFTVTKTADTNDGTCDADCSLREAIAAAVADAADDVIEFDVLVFGSPQIITLSGSELSITTNGTLTINGPGADLLTVSGDNASRVLFNDTAAVTTVNGLRFSQGNAVGAVNTGRGGAIYNRGGTLTVNDSVIDSNSASNGGGSNAAGSATTTYNSCVFSNNNATGAGGGIQNFSGSTLTINGTSITGNFSGSTITGGGGGQLNGTVTITNSTVSNNETTDSGGGFYYNGQGLTMTNTTIADNSSVNDGGGIHKATSNLNAFLRNNLIADNSGAAASTDITGVFNSNGTNLIETVGTSSGWIASDLLDQAALISPLGYYGGNGFTHVPLSNSPALDAGNNCVTDLTCPSDNPPAAVLEDQRGAVRPANAIVEIGSVESSSTYIATMPNGAVGVFYSETITNDPETAGFAVTGGSLPPGINLVDGSMDTKAGMVEPVTLTGTPTIDGTFDSVITISSGPDTADINYQITIAGAFSSVGGRVVDSEGRGIGRVYLTISDAGIPRSGIVQTVISNPFGYFRFTSVPTGLNYTISPEAKERSFMPVVVPVNGNISDLVIMESPPPLN